MKMCIPRFQTILKFRGRVFGENHRILNTQYWYSTAEVTLMFSHANVLHEKSLQDMTWDKMITEHLSFAILYAWNKTFDGQIEYPHAKFTCTAKHFRILPINKIQVNGFKYINTYLLRYIAFRKWTSLSCQAKLFI